ncbi:MAG: pyridoxal phosphate-dependent aminotransferase [Methanobacteriota archaeon]
MTRGPAERMRRVAESGTVRMAELERELQRQGKQTVSFSIGQPDFPTPANIRAAAATAIEKGHTGYTSSWGIPELRSAIAKKSERENKIPAKPEDVIVSPAKQALFSVFLSYLSKGDRVVLPDPAWAYEPMVQLSGADVDFAATREPDGFALDEEALKEAIGPKTRMVLVNSPSNPTGAVFTDANVKAVADLAKDHDLWVVSDEIYEKIVYTGRAPLSIASLPGMWERTFTVNGLSKAYSMTGWRMGWIVAPKNLLLEVYKIQQHSLTCAVSFAQHAAVEALTGPQDSVEAMRREFEARRDLIVQGLRSIEGFALEKAPEGAFYVFPRYGFEMDSDKFAEHLLREALVAVTPGDVFGPHGGKHVRISYAASREQIQEGLRRIRECVSRL